MFRRCAMVLGVLCIPFCDMEFVLASVTYTVTDLGTLGGVSSCAYGINNIGQVVGDARDASNQDRAFLYSKGTMVDLGSLGGDPAHSYSCAEDINARGQVAGHTLVQVGSTPPEYAFLYSNGTLTNLGTVPDTSYTNSAAYGINDSAQVVGNCLMGYSGIYPIYHAFLYSNESMTDLGAPTDYLSTQAHSINNSGQVVGTMVNAGNTVSRAFLYSGGSMTDIGTLQNYTQATAGAINDSGQVVGYSYTPGVGGHAFLYTDGTMTDLGSLDGSNKSNAADINAGGQVVGLSYYAGGGTDFHAFVYSNGTMSDLNDRIDDASGWTLSAAYAINDSGMVVGNGLHNGTNHAFLLTPVPEPSVAILMASGVLVVAIRAWRRGRGEKRKAEAQG